ncbi:MAG: hypothetical protein RR554_05345 [Vagococcus sp.]|uniref:hypothetical protein n=1 Tax=Vagococcus sp. TaxID=1933889 RepID=UPI002FC7D8A7
MKKHSLSLLALIVLTMSLSGCALNNEAKASSSYESKASTYFYDEKEIAEKNSQPKYPTMDVAPAKIVTDAKKYAGTYSLDWGHIETAGLRKNLLKVNNDGTFVELRVLTDNATNSDKRYYVDKKNKLHSKKPSTYALLSGYVTELKGDVFLSYANATQFYNALNEKGEDKISPLPFEYNYQTFKYTGYQGTKFVDNTFEVNLEVKDGIQKFVKVVPKATPRELTVTPLEISEFLKDSKEKLTSKNYEFNNINDFLQILNRKIPQNHDIQLLDINSYQNFETTDEGNRKAIYAFSSTSSEENDVTTYLYDGERIFVSQENNNKLFEEFEF